MVNVLLFEIRPPYRRDDRVRHHDRTAQAKTRISGALPRAFIPRSQRAQLPRAGRGGGLETRARGGVRGCRCAARRLRGALTRLLARKRPERFEQAPPSSPRGTLSQGRCEIHRRARTSGMESPTKMLLMKHLAGVCVETRRLPFQLYAAPSTAGAAQVLLCPHAASSITQKAYGAQAVVFGSSRQGLGY